jgi:hypothetical protein
MARLSKFARINREGVPEEQLALVEKLASSINSFAEELNFALDRRLTVDDNLNMSYKEIDVTLSSSGQPVNKTQFRSGITGRCRAISVERVENIDNPATYPSAAPFVSFIDNSGLITINHITGLQSGSRWRLTLLTKA